MCDTGYGSGVGSQGVNYRTNGKKSYSSIMKKSYLM